MNMGSGEKEIKKTVFFTSSDRKDNAKTLDDSGSIGLLCEQPNKAIANKLNTSCFHWVATAKS